MADSMLHDRWIIGELHRLMGEMGDNLLVTIEWVSAMEASRIKVSRDIRGAALADTFFDEESRKLSLDDFAERILKPMVSVVSHG